jgi:hypothetical protein
VVDRMRRILEELIPKPILIYTVALLAIYALPIGLEGEWYNFYEYLDRHNAAPYIDVREGYPPLGFLIYMPLYHISGGSQTLFYYLLRFVNGLLLSSTLYTLYLTVKYVSGEGRALRYTLYYGLLPSVIIANTYSNDIVSLLPASLSIYAIVRRKPILSGLLIGLAALGKGFPAILLIPALLYFGELTDKIKLAGSAILLFLYASLPFMLIAPFTYISTFTHHASRGPWETIWALIEGYYSHGGLLHPYFDKFFYHDNLLYIYEPNPYDHAFYEWKYGFLPTLLTSLQIIMIILIALTLYDRKLSSKDIVSSCGSLYTAYMLFFKGYSTQFAVSTPFYTLITAIDSPLKLLIPLEVSHILQILSWNAQSIHFTLRNLHMEMLISAILIRTAILSYTIARYLEANHPNIKSITCVIRNIVYCLASLLKDCVVCIGSIIILFSAFSTSIYLHSYVGGGSLRIVTGEIEASTDRWTTIHLEDLAEGDQIIALFDTNTWLEFQVSGIPESGLEYGLVNPYNLKNSFNQSLLFFQAKLDKHDIYVRMKHPKIPFRITDGLDKDLLCHIRYENSTLTIELKDEGLDKRNSIFRIAYLYSTRIGYGFPLPIAYSVIGSSSPTIMLDIFDDKDEWIYTIRLPATPHQPVVSCEIPPYILGDDISLIALVVSLNDGDSTAVKLYETIGNTTSHINLYAENTEKIHYKILIERDPISTPEYQLNLSISTILLPILLYRTTQISRRGKPPLKL